MDQLTYLPWYIKLFLSLGGAGMIWKSVEAGIPKAADWVKSWLVHAIATVDHRILSNPVALRIVVSEKDRLLPVIRQVRDATVALVQAAETQVEQDVQNAKEQNQGQ